MDSVRSPRCAGADRTSCDEDRADAATGRLSVKTPLVGVPVLIVALVAVGCAPAVHEVGPQLPPGPAGEGQSIYLFREVVSFEIKEGEVIGRGFYYFRNPAGAERAFSAALAFFVAPWQGAPEQVQFTHVPPESDKPLPYVWLDRNCPLTQIIVPPRGTYCLRVDWKQKLSGKKFVYLLLREQPWNRKREHLRLTLLLPRDLRRVDINYKCTYKSKTPTHRCYVIVRDNFEPPANLEVTWK